MELGAWYVKRNLKYKEREKMIITAIWYYILDVVLCMATFSVVRKLYRKQPLINWEKTLRTITSKKIRKGIERGYLVLLIFFFLLCVGEIVIPSIKDLPLVVSGKYLEDKGTIFKVTKDTIYIRGNERKEIVIGDRSTRGFQEGDVVLVHYYPNMERGFVYQIEECE